MSKNLKKIFAIMLALCLTLGLTTVAFAEESNGTEEAVRLLGDVNGDGKVAAVDARIVLRASADLHKEGIDLKDVTSEDFWTADVNADNRISAVDARRILRVSARLDDFAGVPTFETKTQINAIIAAITTALDDISVEDKNQYYNDVIDSIAAELAPHFDAEDIVTFEGIVTVLKAIELGAVDWVNANTIIEILLPKVLAWANAADVATIAGMIADEEVETNAIVDFVVEALFTDEAIDAVLVSLKEDGLVDSLKAAIEILDEAGILRAIYAIHKAMPDSLKFDDFAAAKAALIEWIDEVATAEKTKPLIDATNTWFKNIINLEKTNHKAIRAFIAGIFKNEPVLADLTAYEAALAAVDVEDYTAESWAIYAAVVGANVVTEEDTQEDVDAATAAIVAAQEALVELDKIEATFEATGGLGIAPETAGDAAGKIYVEYKMVVDGEQISLTKDDIESIKVKIADGEWKSLTPDTDKTLWFNVEATAGLRSYKVVDKDGKVYVATLDWAEEIKTATWVATGKSGEAPETAGEAAGKIYDEYKLMDGENQISLEEGDVKLIARLTDGKWKKLTPNTDDTLWFNVTHAAGDYDFFVMTSDNVMYKATLTIATEA